MTELTIEDIPQLTLINGILIKSVRSMRKQGLYVHDIEEQILINQSKIDEIIEKYKAYETSYYENKQTQTPN